MHLFINTTSPFVRLVRLAIAEKGLADRITAEWVNPWADPPGLLAPNPAGRVPTLVLDDGTAITEAQLILRYLDTLAAPPVFPAEDQPRTLAIAALALGVIEAAVAIIIGPKSSEGFDTDLISRKRFRTMAEALARIDAMLPAHRPDIANLATVTALDYILFRFADRDWLAGLPALRDWRAAQAGRVSVETTMPHG